MVRSSHVVLLHRAPTAQGGGPESRQPHSIVSSTPVASSDVTAAPMTRDPDRCSTTSPAAAVQSPPRRGYLRASSPVPSKAPTATPRSSSSSASSS